MIIRVMERIGRKKRLTAGDSVVARHGVDLFAAAARCAEGALFDDAAIASHLATLAGGAAGAPRAPAAVLAVAVVAWHSSITCLTGTKLA